MLTTIVPVTNRTLFDEFLIAQLKDDLADCKEELSVENLQHHERLTLNTIAAIAALNKEVELTCGQ